MINHNLSILIAVVEKGSFTEAAKQLYISQPAISQAIKTLEQELDVQILYRHKRKKIQLTPIGQKIYQFALEMTHLEKQLKQTICEENKLLKGQLRIGALPILTAALLPKILHRFKQLFPNIDVILTEGKPKELREKLENHQIDLALTSSPFHGFSHLTLLQDRMVGIFSPQIPMTTIDLRKDNSDLILVDAALETTSEQLIKSDQLDFSKSTMTTTPEAVLALVKANLGRGIISEYTLNVISPNYPHTEVIPNIEFEIGFQFTHESDLTPVAKAFLEMIDTQN